MSKNDSVRSVVDAILDNNPAAVREALDNAITEKAQEAIAFQKVKVAKSLFGKGE